MPEPHIIIINEPPRVEAPISTAKGSHIRPAQQSAESRRQNIETYKKSRRKDEANA